VELEQSAEVGCLATARATRQTPDFEPREIERVAEEVGRQVEQWLSEEQEQIVQAGPSVPPQLKPGAKFYISFDETGVPVRKSELVGRRGK
jgi:hypothetical protein